jgi:hypothetical protein
MPEQRVLSKAMGVYFGQVSLPEGYEQAFMERTVKENVPRILANSGAPYTPRQIKEYVDTVIGGSEEEKGYALAHLSEIDSCSSDLIKKTDVGAKLAYISEMFPQPECRRSLLRPYSFDTEDGPVKATFNEARAIVYLKVPGTGAMSLLESLCDWPDMGILQRKDEPGTDMPASYMMKFKSEELEIVEKVSASSRKNRPQTDVVSEGTEVWIDKYSPRIQPLIDRLAELYDLAETRKI